MLLLVFITAVFMNFVESSLVNLWCLFRWGGCVVALTTADHVDKFIATVKEQFYSNNPEAGEQPLENLIFATQPGQGVQIFSPCEDATATN